MHAESYIPYIYTLGMSMRLIFTCACAVILLDLSIIYYFRDFRSSVSSVSLIALYSHSSPASLEQTPASIAKTIWPIIRTHQNLTPCYLSTTLSFQTENTALQQILS